MLEVFRRSVVRPIKLHGRKACWRGNAALVVLVPCHHNISFLTPAFSPAIEVNKNHSLIMNKLTTYLDMHAKKFKLSPVLVSSNYVTRNVVSITRWCGKIVCVRNIWITETLQKCLPLNGLSLLSDIYIKDI